MAATIQNVVRRSNHLAFEFHNIDVGVANALRRVVLAEVPNVAIAFDPYNPALNDITILKNTTSLHNEFMGHRISMIPIYLDHKDVVDWNPENYRFVIQGKNTSNTVITLTTEHITAYDRDNNPVTDKEFFPKDPITGEYVLITKLKPNDYNNKEGDEFHAEFRARKGVARHHARWSPVSQCAFFNTIDEAAASSALADMLRSKAKTDQEKKQLSSNFNVLEKQRYFIKNARDEPIAFTFNIESECKIPPSVILLDAFDVLKSKLVEMPSKMDVQCIHEEQSLFMIQVNQEDHTLGNLIQTMAYTHYVVPKDVIDFIGYFMPHPLEHYIVFKIKFIETTREDGVRKFITDLCAKCIEELQHLRDLCEEKLV